MSKFNIGNRVQIVGYGEMGWQPACCGKQGSITDSMPDLIGKQGVIEEVLESGERTLYTLSGIPSKRQFYRDEQLKLIP